MDFSFFLILFVVVTVYQLASYFYVKATRPKEKDGKKLVYPDELPNRPYQWAHSDLVGLMKAINNEGPLEFWYQTYKQYGLTVRHILPLQQPAVMTFDPDIVEYILKTNFPNYVKGEMFHDNFEQLLGNGIFNADGTIWKTQRATASHLFSVKELKEMAQVFTSHSEIAMEVLAKRQKEKVKFELQEFFQQYTLDTFSEIAFGVPTKCLTLPIEETPFAKAFDHAVENISFRFLVSPWWKYLPWTSNEKNLAFNSKICDDFIKNIIKQRRTDSGISNRFDLLSKYMRMQDDNGQPFSDQYLRDIALNMLLAGRDTTAALLTMTFYLLAQHPEVEAKLIEEIDRELKGEKPGFENIKNLEYLKAVLNEALRLYPPVPINNKLVVDDDVLPNGVVVKRGQRVWFSLYVLGRIDESYDEPLKFLPERWMPDYKGRIPKPNSFMPFNYGPRLCLGKEMAYIEAKIMVAMLLQKYRLVIPAKKIVLTPSATLKIAGGLKAEVALR